MQFSINQKALSSALDKISAATDSKHQLSVYRAIKVTVVDRWVKLLATSSTMTAELAFEVDAPNSSVPVEFGVSQDLFSKVVGALPSSLLTFSIAGNQLSVATPNSQFKLNLVSPESFPPSRNFEQISYAAVDMPFLLHSMGKVSYCRNPAAERPRFRCVYIDHEHFTATDGYRMSIFPNKIGYTQSQPSLLSSDTVDRLQKLFGGCGQEGGIFVSENEVIFAQGTTQVAVRTLAETYPNYKSVIPKSKATRVVFERRDLLNALRRVLIVAERNRFVDLQLTSSGLSISSNSPEAGSAGEAVYCDVTDFQDIAVTINGDYAIDALKAMDQDKAVLELRSPDVSIVITDGEHINVIQPVRRD